MIIEYLIMKLTFEAIVSECNRLAMQEETREHRNWINSRLLELKTEYEKGVIGYDVYVERVQEISDELDNPPQNDDR